MAKNKKILLMFSGGSHSLRAESKLQKDGWDVIRHTVDLEDPESEDPVVIYKQHGDMAVSAVEACREQGIKNVASGLVPADLKKKSLKKWVRGDLQTLETIGKYDGIKKHYPLMPKGWRP